MHPRQERFTPKYGARHLARPETITSTRSTLMRRSRVRTLAVATVATGLLAGGITAGTTDILAGDKPADTIANAAAPKNPSEPTEGLPTVKGLQFTLGERSVKLSWKKVRGADGYVVYADYSCDNVPRSTNSYQLLKKYVGETSWTHKNIQETCVNYAVVALRDGVEGARPPVGERVVTSMVNRDHTTAARKFFTAAPASGDQVARTSVAPGQDRGIVLARAYIRNKTAFTDAIGDHRSWTPDPTASAKITIAWNTGTGQVAAYIHKSCLAGTKLPNGDTVEAGCFDALPPAFVPNASSVGDASTERRNLISVSRAGSGGLSIGFSAVNSISSTLGRIDGQLTLSPHKDTFRTTLTADKFPAWEIIRYPHLVQGAPLGEARLIGTRDQTEISDLTSGRQSTCTSKGDETREFTNPMAC
ncbi:hypothetical protein [Streptomyces sp. NPDC060366]|uniref:hypothetical protein n=1 Tax=Streptomyces sp. NPDC060366 TaxID=3347105 RepID=UPI00364CC18C